MTLAAILDLRRNKNIARAGDIGIWSLFLFFISFSIVNQNREFGLVWTIFFPIFVMLIRPKSGMPFIFLFYAILFFLSFYNVGTWQDGAWSVTSAVRFAMASSLLVYVVYVIERSRNLADEKNEELLRREKEYNAQLEDYKAQLESKVEKTLGELSEKEKIILRNAQLAEMGNLISVIAHQLKQPLGAINLQLFCLRDDYETGEMNQENLDTNIQRIELLVDHMSGTIDDFRNFFNPNKPKTTFNLAGAVRKTCELLEPQLKQASIRLERHLEEAVEIYGHESELQQALINIVHNSKDALTEKETSDPVVSIACFYDPAGNSARLTVEDNGGGIPENVIENIFDSYFTTKGTSGTGIGLFLVRKIVVEGFQGTVNVENRERGARFMISLPGSAAGKIV